MTEILPVPAASADAASGSSPEFCSVTTPQRQGKALLGWLSEPVVRPIFHILTVTSPGDLELFVAEARSRRQARTRIPLTPPAPAAVSELPTALAPRADCLRASDQFKTAYEPFGAMFAVVPLGELVTPQWWADAGYVEALAASAPAEDDLDGMFDFSFSMGRLARPMNLGLNGAAFASARGDSGSVGPLRVARYSPERVTFEFDITPRPNWIWLAASQDMTRLLILNGVHHLLALMKAGRRHAYCLLRPAHSLDDLRANGWDPQNPELFKPDELKGARPPLLRDYLDDEHAADVGIHLRQSYLRLAVQAEPCIIPRVE
jgi:hypothetical protein